MMEFELKLSPEENNRGLLAELVGINDLEYVSVSTIAVRRAAWNNYTPTIPCGDSAVATYIQLLGCFNEEVNIEKMKEFVLSATDSRKNPTDLDIVSCGKAAGTIGSIYCIPGYHCFIDENYCHVKTENNELYKFDSEDIPRDELWDFLTLNAIVYILSEGKTNLCYNDKLTTLEGLPYEKNMTNNGYSLMYWDRFTKADGETGFIRSLKGGR